MPRRSQFAAAGVSLLLVAACTGGEAPPTVGEASRVTFHGADPGDHAGAVLAGDFNGDGRLDILLTASAADGPGNTRPDAGEAYIFLGPFSPGTRLDAAEQEYDAIIFGAMPGDQLGRASTVGDFNGDDIDDIALASPFASPDDARNKAGVVQVLYGSGRLGSTVRRTDLGISPADVTVLGADAGDAAGFALAAADLNRDGVSDLIIGAFQADSTDNGRPEAGEVYVVYGDGIRSQIDLSLGDQDAIIYGADSGDRLGEAVGAGDIDGDGRADLIVAAPFAAGPSNGREAAGEVYVIISPAPLILDLAAEPAGLTVLGADPGDQLGHSLASGDADCDGFDDIWSGSVSADGPDNRADLAGEAHLVLGARILHGLIDTAAGEAAARVFGPINRERLGRSAAAAAINGDCFSDLLISAPDARERRGVIYLVFGRPGSSPYPQTATTADLDLAGLDPGDILGHEAFGMPSLATADIDADGHPEVLAAAPMAGGPTNDRPESGEAYIIFLTRRP